MVNPLQLIIEKNPKIIFRLPKLNTNYWESKYIYFLVLFLLYIFFLL
jgi:hypothetical protein